MAVYHLHGTLADLKLDDREDFSETPPDEEELKKNQSPTLPSKAGRAKTLSRAVRDPPAGRIFQKESRTREK